MPGDYTSGETRKAALHEDGGGGPLEPGTSKAVIARNAPRAHRSEDLGGSVWKRYAATHEHNGHGERSVPVDSGQGCKTEATSCFLSYGPEV
jgi:hypothetical protein